MFAATFAPHGVPWVTARVIRSIVVIGASIVGLDAMIIEMASQAEADEEILTCDIPDAVLERAGNAEQQAFTMFYCTHQSYECGLH